MSGSDEDFREIKRIIGSLPASRNMEFKIVDDREGSSGEGLVADILNGARAIILRKLTLQAYEISREAGPYKEALNYYLVAFQRIRSLGEHILKAAAILSESQGNPHRLGEFKKVLDFLKNRIETPLRRAKNRKMRVDAETAAENLIKNEIAKRIFAIVGEKRDYQPSRTSPMAVLQVDLAKYTEKAEMARDLLGQRYVAILDRSIHDLVMESVKNVAGIDGNIPAKKMGDGILFLIDSVDAAVKVAESIHLSAMRRNGTAANPTVCWYFRIAISMDEVVMTPPPESTESGQGIEFAGTAIIEAVRLQSACRTGEILITDGAYSQLPKPQQTLFQSRGDVVAKHGRKYLAYARRVIDPAPWDTAPTPPHP
jgi:class 3 adenylate cyclase